MTDSSAGAATRDDQMDSWDAYLIDHQGHFNVDFIDAARTNEFAWKTSAQSVGNLQVVRFSTDPMDYSRSASDVRLDADDGQRVMIPLNKGFTIAQNDYVERFGPGDVAVVQWGSQVHLQHTSPLDALILTVPVHAVDPDRARAAPLALDMRRPTNQSLRNRIVEIDAHRGEWTAEEFRLHYGNVLDFIDGMFEEKRADEFDRDAYLTEQARQVMKKRADDIQLTLKAIAEECGVSERKLAYAVKETLGIGPAALLRDIRLKRANGRLIREGIGNLKEISEAAGYSRTSYFRAKFKERFEKTPEELFG
ncbi:AraC family transcriptional regulator [Nocardia sp. BMG51109]|uniref:AraC family transcriptional regulator n=1 Tax=Nocardia sp. BMG51109 TaxID=1056816 RepID=UPI0012EC2A85|nr:AraC family transcriptional regulator [Nocardia sp. BMG51109]